MTIENQIENTVVKKRKKKSSFDFWYMFAMVIYMGQATPETGRMVGGLSGNPIPLLLPMILTLCLISKHKVRFHSKTLWMVFGLITIWAGLLYGFKLQINTEELSFMFFLYYAIIVAYCQVKAFGKKIIPLYEKVITVFAAISIPLWFIGAFIPVSAGFFKLFEDTSYGNNVVYLFTWMDPAKGQIYGSLLRNAGCSWEPGRFAIMIVLGIYCNLSRRGLNFSFRKNRNLWILVASLLSTQSTTGFCATILMFIVFFIKKVNFKYVLYFVCVLLPLIYFISQLDFMAGKIAERMDVKSQVAELREAVVWQNNAKSGIKEGEYLGSLDRFMSIAMEAQFNIPNDPLLGYGRNDENSYFYRKVTSNLVLTGGLLKQFSMYGIPLGIIFYVFMVISSFALAKESNVKRPLALIILFIASTISYPIFGIPVFTSFWMYGIFNKETVLAKSRKRKSVKRIVARQNQQLSN